MDFKDFLPFVVPSDVPETYQLLVEMIGLDAFMKLCQYCMGDKLYIPTPDTITKKARNRMIVKEYDGTNIKKLSRKYGITIPQLRSILKDTDE